ncbi:MAG: HAD-IB family hydrolase [Acidimicrobiales bacterium]
MAAGAFFDLDRTLLASSSGATIADMMHSRGLPAPSIPGQRLLFALYERFGEDPVSMAFARQAVRMAAGRRRDELVEVGELAAPELADRLLPFARAEIARHRRDGHRLVMATTTPHELVEPLARRLGFDDVVATRYRAVHGVFDGTIDGEFTWGRGKLSAVEAWCRADGVDLADSWAYSDSYYDAPLLRAVAHPVAVNPDARLRVIARVSGWPVRDFRAPEGVATISGHEVQELLMILARPELLPLLEADVDGVDRIPSEGPAILAANHRSYFDPVVVAWLAYTRNRPIRYLGKAELFEHPVVGPLMRALGMIRVDRGSGASQPLDEAADYLRAGELIGIMPQGTIPRGPAFFEPDLKARPGVARLAAMVDDVPVVPIGLWGTDQVWPRSARLPRLWQIPEVRVRVGSPVRLAHESHTADTAAIMDAISRLLPAEARHSREPTVEELARTYPPGSPGDLRPDADGSG